MSGVKPRDTGGVIFAKGVVYLLSEVAGPLEAPAEKTRSSS